MVSGGTGSQDDDQRTLIHEAVSIQNMAQLRSHVMRLAAQAGLSTERAAGFAVAVHEAVINAIEHAGGRGEVAVVQDDERRLIAEVHDPGADTACSIALTMPPVDATRGRGMWLAGQLTDHIEVHGDQGGTTVRLEMDLRKPQPEPPG